MKINFKKKYFHFNLSQSIKTSKKKIIFKHGWLIKLENKNKIGFGEISPLSQNNFKECQRQIIQIPPNLDESNLLQNVKSFHPCVQSALHTAMAELKGELILNDNNQFKNIDQTAILCDSHSIQEDLKIFISKNKSMKKPITLKWKVGIKDNNTEELLLEQILNQIKNNIRLRIDANGAWSRRIADRWADILKGNENIDWLEQPLTEDDLEGLKALQKKIPVALDESLLKYPNLIEEWDGWQIRRPSQESNPISLMKELENKKGYRSISTSFETGIGRRIIYHLASLQLEGPTPKVPGLALKQTPKSSLFSSNAKLVWDNL